MLLSLIMCMPWFLVVLKQNLSPKAAPGIQPLGGANHIDNFLATAGT